MFGMQIGQMGQVGGFSWTRLIASMYQNGEQGAWYDPSDMSTLFQDSAGTTPVTAVEQPVGRLLDKSGRGNHATQATTTKRPTYSRRVNLLINTASQAAWSYQGSRFTAGSVDGNGAALLTASVESNLLAGVHTDYPIGASYTQPACIVRSIEVKAGTATHLSFGSAGNYVIVRLSDGVIEYQQNLTTATVAPSDDGYWRVELLSENLTWSASALSNYICWGKGRSGAAIIATDQIGSTVYVRKPSYVVNWFGFRGSVPYQRVNTATDYDADPAKYPAYLRFDGVDDALQTGNIDFTGTDKMTVWAGVTKLSDAAPSTLLELSVNSYSNLGTIGLFTPTTVNGNDIAQRSIGTSERVLTVGGFTSPMSFVVTGYMGITPPIIGLRIAGSVIGTTSASQGTGNYGNYPLYIGARAGASLFFNGRLYSLIVRGAATPLPQIEAVETLIRQKMRLP